MDWKFKQDAPTEYSDEFWYDITVGGYLDPADYLDDPEQIKKLNEAVDLVHDFEAALESLGV